MIDFSDIIEIHNKIIHKLDNINTDNNKLKDIYVEYIQGYKDKNLSLSLFDFQKNTIKFEYNYLYEFYNLINNKIYCHYYKLYKLIIKFIILHLKNKINYKENNYEPYKDLETLKKYDFETVVDLNNDILILLSSIEKYNENKNKIINQTKDIINDGLNMDLFLHEISFEKNNLQNQIDNFKTYLHKFNHFHYFYLNILNKKIDKYNSESVYYKINDISNVEPPQQQQKQQEQQKQQQERELEEKIKKEEEERIKKEEQINKLREEQKAQEEMQKQQLQQQFIQVQNRKNNKNKNKNKK